MYAQPTAFDLLVLPDVTLSTPTIIERGELTLQCVTLTDARGPRTASPTTTSLSDDDVILILRINSIELPLDPRNTVSLHITPSGDRTYSLQLDLPSSSSLAVSAPSSYVQFTIPSPENDTHLADSIETFDHILTQYAHLSLGAVDFAPERDEKVEDLRGRLVLMDEQSGELVSTVGDKLVIKEGSLPAQKAGDTDANAVVLDLPSDLYDAYTGAEGITTADLLEAREVFVRAIPPEQEDWITKSGTMISQAITSSASVLVSGMSIATKYYINHSSPAHPTPPSIHSGPSALSSCSQNSGRLKLMTSPSAHVALSGALAVSGKAAQISERTMNLVEGMIRRAVGGKEKVAPIVPKQTAAQYPPPPYPGPPLPSRSTVPPPLPPRSGRSTPNASSELSQKSPMSALDSTNQVGNAPIGESNTSNARKPLRTREKLALSANLVLATIDDSTRRVFDVGSARLGEAVGHKYGPAAAHSTHLATHTARNVVLVYIDVRGFARRAILRKVGKEIIKAQIVNSSSRTDCPSDNTSGKTPSK